MQRGTRGVKLEDDRLYLISKEFFADNAFSPITMARILFPELSTILSPLREADRRGRNTVWLRSYITRMIRKRRGDTPSLSGPSASNVDMLTLMMAVADGRGGSEGGESNANSATDEIGSVPAHLDVKHKYLTDEEIAANGLVFLVSVKNALQIAVCNTV